MTPEHDHVPKHTWMQGHNGCCKTCVKMITDTADLVTRHLEEEGKAYGFMEGKLDTLLRIGYAIVIGSTMIIMAKVVALILEGV